MPGPAPALARALLPEAPGDLEPLDTLTIVEIPGYAVGASVALETLADALAAVRLGGVLAIALGALADRRGRRLGPSLALLVCIGATGAGAAAPHLATPAGAPAWPAGRAPSRGRVPPPTASAPPVRQGPVGQGPPPSGRRGRAADGSTTSAWAQRPSPRLLATR